uniref:Uncharacterized protein n=1 Tax=Heliothis virescens TaxID=7102 RepID=A0A2A4J7E8_HELVI
MKTEFGGEIDDGTDEEECDDPIRLFDMNAVCFGSQPSQDGNEAGYHWQFEKIDDGVPCQPSEVTTDRRADYSQLNIKLVDCFKFPWYYRKYTQQILRKLNPGDSDSDTEVDVLDIDDCESNDCYIVVDLQNNTDKVNNDVSQDKQEDKIISKVNQERMKTWRNNVELQKALSIKNVAKIDFKRNTGLVGMKIMPKVVTNGGLDAPSKINDKKQAKATTKDKMNIDKGLSSVDSCTGTQETPSQKGNSLVCQPQINNSKQDTVVEKLNSSNITNTKTVPLHVSKPSEKQVSTLTNVNEIIDLSSETKHSRSLLKTVHDEKDNVLSEKDVNSGVVEQKKQVQLVKPTEKVLTSNVRDIKKTNKYKNDQIKNQNKAVNSSLTLNNNIAPKIAQDDTKEVKHTKQKRNKNIIQNKIIKSDKKPNKKVEKQKCEPKSPILPCSTLPKKPKPKCPLEVPNKSNKSDASTKNLNAIIGKLTSLKYSSSQNLFPTKQVLSKPAAVPHNSDISIKQALQYQSSLTKEKAASQLREIHDKILKLPEKDVKNFVRKVNNKTTNLNNTPVNPSSIRMNNNSIEQKKPDKVIDNVNTKPPLNNVPVMNPATINKSKPIPAVTPSIDSKPKSISEKYKNFLQSLGPEFAEKSKADKSVTQGKVHFYPVQNRYASAIILKPNQQTTPQGGNPRGRPMQGVPPQRCNAMPIPVHTQRFQDIQQLYPQYYQSSPAGRYQNNFPGPAVNPVPHQFLPPHDNLQQNNPQAFYQGRYNLPRSDQNTINPLQYDPCLNPSSYPPISNMRQLPNTFPQKPGNNLHTNSSSIIGVNNGGLVKKINIVAVPAASINDKKETIEEVKTPQIMTHFKEPEVVATKTEMLEELDKVTFVDDMTYDGYNENTLDVAIMSNQSGRFESLKLQVNKNDSVLKQQAKGYSPPILPIPTYKKVLDQVALKAQLSNKVPQMTAVGDPRLHIKSESKPLREEVKKGYKRKLTNAFNKPDDNKRRDDAKKISLEEYKKRICKSDSKPAKVSKKICKEKFKVKRPNAKYNCRENSTDTDLGYDSDTTVVL